MRYLLAATVLAATVIVALCAAATARAAEKTYDLDHLAFLEGCWTGTGLGGEAGECWMRAPDGRLTGVFQFLKNGRQSFSEIIVIDTFEDGPALRLKHFHADLRGWETQDEYVSFPLVSTTPDSATFEGMRIRLSEAGELSVEVLLSAKDGEENWTTFTYRRMSD